MTRGTVKADGSRLVAVRMPIDLSAAVRQAVILEDSDFSKFVRNAIRDRLVRIGVMPTTSMALRARYQHSDPDPSPDGHAAITSTPGD